MRVCLFVLFLVCCSSFALRAACPGIWQMFNDMFSTSCIGTVIRQSDIPYTISAPGIYSVGEALNNINDLPVITIAADDVVLDLKCHTITVNQGASVHNGIAIVAPSHRVTVRNGYLLAEVTGPALPTVLMTTAGESITVEHVGFSSNATASLGDLSSGIVVLGGFDHVVSDCTFENIQFGCTGIATDLLCVRDCLFRFVFDTAVGTFNSADIVMNNCQFFMGSRHVRLVQTDGAQITNCQSENAGLVSNDKALELLQATRVTIQGCNINKTGFRPVYVPHVDGIAIHNSMNVMIRESDIQDVSGDGIVAQDETDHLVVRGCTINRAALNGINLISTTSSYVFNCEVVGSGASNYVGIPADLIVTDDVSTSTVNYWMNISRV